MPDQPPTAPWPRRGLVNRVLGRAPDIDRDVPYGLRIGAAYSWRLLTIMAVLGVLLWLIVQFRYLVIPLLIAVLLGALLIPVVDWLQHHRWPRGLAVAVTEVGALALITALIWLAVIFIRGGVPDIVERTTMQYENLTAWLMAPPFDLSQQQIDGAITGLVDWVQAESDAVVAGALSVGTTVGHVLIGVLLVLFSTVFVLLDGRGIWRWLVGLFPRRSRGAVDGAAKAGWTSLGSFVRVQILVAAIDAVGIGIGSIFFTSPALALPIAVLVFLGSFIPVVGAIITGAVAVFIALVYNGLFAAVLMLAVVLAVQQIEGHVLQPLIMGNAVKVHPLGVVVAVAAGGSIAGIAGALFAVPIVAFLNTAVSYVASGAWRNVPNPTERDVL